MDELLVYISYDPYEYTNYFHLAVNNEVVIEYCAEESVDSLFDIITAKESRGKNFKLYVVQDEKALEWDYLRAFQDHGIEMHPVVIDKDSGQLCQIMSALFDGEYGVSGEDDTSNRKLIKIVYVGNCVLQKDTYEADETLRQAEEILNRGGEEMTELARIIREKYERMDRHGQF